MAVRHQMEILAGRNRQHSKRQMMRRACSGLGRAPTPLPRLPALVRTKRQSQELSFEDPPPELVPGGGFKNLDTYRSSAFFCLS